MAVSNRCLVGTNQIMTKTEHGSKGHRQTSSPVRWRDSQGRRRFLQFRYAIIEEGFRPRGRRIVGQKQIAAVTSSSGSGSLKFLKPRHGPPSRRTPRPPPSVTFRWFSVNYNIKSTLRSESFIDHSRFNGLTKFWPAFPFWLLELRVWWWLAAYVVCPEGAYQTAKMMSLSGSVIEVETVLVRTVNSSCSCLHSAWFS